MPDEDGVRSAEAGFQLQPSKPIDADGLADSIIQVVDPPHAPSQPPTRVPPRDQIAE